MCPADCRPLNQIADRWVYHSQSPQKSGYCSNGMKTALDLIDCKDLWLHPDRARGEGGIALLPTPSDFTGMNLLWRGWWTSMLWNELSSRPSVLVSNFTIRQVQDVERHRYDNFVTKWLQPRYPPHHLERTRLSTKMMSPLYCSIHGQIDGLDFLPLIYYHTTKFKLRNLRFKT